MLKHWWKVLGIILMAYTIIVGFLMPLKPGIEEVSPQSFQSGSEIILEVSTYNAKLNKLNLNNFRSWLVHDSDNTISSELISINENGNLELKYAVPQYLPTSESTGIFSLVIDAPKIGSFVLPASIYIRQDSISEENAKSEWSGKNFKDLNSYEGYAIPFRNILKETLRNTYFHVSLWFSMFILYFVSMIYSISYLRKHDYNNDHIASSLVEVGTLFGVLGLITGAIWAKNTWGTYWTSDVKLNMAAISMMIYMAYLILRSSMNDEDRRAVISSSYNIFAFFVIIPLIFVIPRLTDSLHPGNGGNPGFGGDDMDNTMRMVFYPAIIAFTLMGLWIGQIIIRYKKIKNKLVEI